MAKKKLTEEEKEELQKKQIQISLDYEKTECIEKCKNGFVLNPTRIFSIGQEVISGAHQKTVVLEVAEDNKMYLIEHDYIVNNPTSKGHGSHFYKRRWVFWVDLFPKINFSEKKIFSKRDELELNYYQTQISSLHSLFYHFGVDLNPDYQRDLVWSMDDKIKLIDSIFDNVDIGKFVFVVRDYKDRQTPHLFEILDGKQRLTAIMEFWEDRFLWNGLLFSQLHPLDQHHFTGYRLSKAELNKPKDLNVLYKFFLKLNTSGKPIDEKHLNKVKSLISEK